MQISGSPLISGNAGSAQRKIAALDFIRAVCAVGIVVYHISSYTSPDAPKLLHDYANGTFGSVYVGIFLLISGFVLQYHYRQIPSVKEFYYKRWRSIFPMFYVAWAYYYLQNVISAGRLFYNGSPLRMILTVLGLDGYFLYRGANYYIVGEWFLGAIVLLYAMYPLLAKIVRSWGWRTLLVMLPLWVWQLHTDVFEIYTSRNLIYCCGYFLTGMLIEKYGLYKNKIIRSAAFALCAVLLFVPIAGLEWEKCIVLSVSMFFVLFAVGEQVMKLPVLSRVFAFIGGISFPIYLVQNKVGMSIVSRFAPATYTGVLKVIAVSLALCFAYAWCIRAIAAAVQKTDWFAKIDNFFLY